MIDPAAKRKIGRTKLSVSQLGFGTAPFGNLLADVSDVMTRDAVDTALHAGLNYFDTAPFYGHGLSEHRLGEGLRGRPRDSFVISTKVGRLLKPDPAGSRTIGPFSSTLPFTCIYDYTYDAAMRSFEDSHQRLGLARIDIAFVHDVTRRWHGDRLEERYGQSMDGAYKALDRLRSEGAVGAIGVGINEVDLLERYARDGAFDCFMLAGRYTLIDTSALPRLLPLCLERNIAVVLAAPFNSGILATGTVPGAKFWYADAPPEIMARVSRIEGVCARHGISLQAAAIQFPLAHPALASVVAGYRNPLEVTAAVAACKQEIPVAFWQELRALGLLDPDAPVPALA